MGVGRADTVTEREGIADFFELVGRFVVEAADERREPAGVEFEVLAMVGTVSSESLRVLETGNAGNGPVGGGGLDVRGRAEVIVVEALDIPEWQQMPLAYLQKCGQSWVFAVIIGKWSSPVAIAASRWWQLAQ